jgi:hypothetical protein
MRVEGLKEVQSALRQLPAGVRKELQGGLRQVGEVVTSAARPEIAVRSGRLVGSLKAVATARHLRVQLGTATRVPYAGWWEFGGTIVHHGQNHSHGGGAAGKTRVATGGAVRSFGKHLIHRPFVRSGRTIYPAYLRTRPGIETRMHKVIDDAVAAARLNNG